MSRSSEMLSVTEACERLLARFQPVDGEALPLEQAQGRILAHAVSAEQD